MIHKNARELENDLSLEKMKVLRLENKLIKLKYAFLVGVSLMVVTSVIAGTSYLYHNDIKRNKVRSLTLANSELSKELETTKKTFEELMSNTSLVYISREDIVEDLNINRPNLSHKAKKLIIKTIFEEAKRYGINPLILYVICDVESNFKIWYEHDSVSATINGKLVKVRPVGLAGIVWEYWGKQLKENGIAETRSDLFDAGVNIRAAAYILDTYYKEAKHKSAKYQDESALLRFYGGNNPWYVQKIEARVAALLRPTIYRKY